MDYLSGFGNHFSTEAIEGALPEGQNSPQHTPLGLYAEQLSGSAFTMPRSENVRSWLYRIRPSVLHEEFIPYEQVSVGSPLDTISPNQLRWKAFDYPNQDVDFIDGLSCLARNGNLSEQKGMAVYIYALNQSMNRRFFQSADGEFLIVPHQGNLLVQTEMGPMDIAPKEICVVPKGIVFSVEPKGKQAGGYVCENYGAAFSFA